MALHVRFKCISLPPSAKQLREMTKSSLFWVYLSVKTCSFFLGLGVNVCVLYIVSGLFVVLLVLCFTLLVRFTGFYPEDEPLFWRTCTAMAHFFRVFLLN